nr:immunoglobulin heavy chain junction region [Mus musculus]MBK4195504.1 immunoglobulin heavy chain junction region [Mus musculus]MBK4195505.1 immunoglobulin heavy chain junction region [Mus musculus]MBK4195507.1 immunoglobulin heavy chain junction region [Mus musculus]
CARKDWDVDWYFDVW